MYEIYGDNVYLYNTRRLLLFSKMSHAPETLFSYILLYEMYGLVNAVFDFDSLTVI